jgi:hypothetical protein
MIKPLGYPIAMLLGALAGASIMANVDEWRAPATAAAVLAKYPEWNQRGFIGCKNGKLSIENITFQRIPELKSGRGLIQIDKEDEDLCSR